MESVTFGKKWAKSLLDRDFELGKIYSLCKKTIDQAVLCGKTEAVVYCEHLSNSQMTALHTVFSHEDIDFDWGMPGEISLTIKGK